MSKRCNPSNWFYLDGGYFAPYVDIFEASSKAAKEWFAKHL